MWFKLKQGLMRWHIKLLNVPFNLRLIVLNWRYGRGNIPHDKLPQIITTAEDEEIFHLIIKACGYLKTILSHYKIPMEDSITAGALSRYMRTESLGEDEHQVIHHILMHEHPALELLKLVQRTGEVSKQKLDFFGPPSSFESMEAWALSLESPNVKS